MRISDWSSDVCSSDLKLQFVPLCFALGLDFDDVCLDHILLHSERREVETYPAVQAIVAASHQSFFLELVGDALDRAFGISQLVSQASGAWKRDETDCGVIDPVGAELSNEGNGEKQGLRTR